MIDDLKLIKNKYGEKMMHLCRELFPSLLEKPGLLSTIMLEHFAENKFLYNDLVNSIQSVLETAGISNVGHYFLEDGLLGYNASFKGWINLGNYPTHVTEHINGTQAEYMTSDNHHIRIRKDGSYGVESSLSNNWYMRVRLIKE